jgi:hypothetical protein
MKNKTKHDILISLTKDKFPLYEQYKEIVKKKNMTIMGSNLELFIKGMEEIIKNNK